MQRVNDALQTVSSPRNYRKAYLGSRHASGRGQLERGGSKAAVLRCWRRHWLV